MVRGVYVTRSPSERMLCSAAPERYLRDVSPEKRPNPVRSERYSAAHRAACEDTYRGASNPGERKMHVELCTAGLAGVSEGRSFGRASESANEQSTITQAV
jgi:hypothetical protein